MLVNKDDLRVRVTNALFAGGYPDYAIALSGFKSVSSLDDKSKLIGCTDAENIYLNKHLDDDELSLVARHEMLHVMLRHRARRTRSTKPLTWNIACDFELSNYYSAFDDRVMAASDLLKSGCSVTLCPEYAGMTAEEIYAKILTDRQKQKQEQQQQNDGDDGDDGDESDEDNGDEAEGKQQQKSKSKGRPSAGKHDEDDEAEDTEDEGEGEAEGEDSDDEADPDESESEGKGEGDEPSEEEEENEGFNPSDMSDEELDQMEKELEEELGERTAILADLSDEEQEKLREELAKAIEDNYDSLTAEQKAQMDDSELVEASGVSGIGGGDAGKLAEQKKPEPIQGDKKLFYSLRRYFVKQQNITKGQSYRRPNKKYASSGFIMKTRTNVYKESKTLAMYVDISGSMSEQKLARAIGVVKTAEKMKRVEVITHYFDTRVRDNFCPGGGTDYECIFKHAKENKYTCIAIVTDDTQGYFNDNYEVEALWIAGIERPWRSDKYQLEREINKPHGHIKARYFDIGIVEPNNY